MRVVIAEDLALLRDGIASLLADDGHEVVAAVGDGEALLDALDEHPPGPRDRRRPDAADADRRGRARRGRGAPPPARTPRS